MPAVKPISVEEMYSSGPLPYEEIEAILDRSRNPRGPDSLFETVSSTGIGPDSHVIDVGARDARYSLVLAERLGCRVTALDPVPDHVSAAREAVAASDVGERIEVVQGVIEEMPFDDGVFDLVFCRDVLSHIVDLSAALAECHRVLGPGGWMVVYQTFATSWMEPQEASRLYPDLAVVPESMDPSRLERCAREAGLSVVSVDPIGSEWRESWEEDGSHRTSRQLLHAARLLRDRQELMGELGEIDYRVELANALWGVYQMIGKLEPRIYVLRRD